MKWLEEDLDPISSGQAQSQNYDNIKRTTGEQKPRAIRDRDSPDEKSVKD